MALVENIRVRVDYPGINILDYGVVGDGVADDTAAYVSVVALSNLSKMPLYCPAGKTVRLVGAGTISHIYGFNYNHSTLDISTFSGQLQMNRAASAVVYGPTSPLVLALVAAGSMTGMYSSGLANRTELNNCYINIATNQPYYTYRTATVNRTERLVSLRNGMLDGVLKYPLAGSSITSITAYALPDNEVVFENVTINMGVNQLRGDNFLVQGDMMRFENWAFKQGDIDYSTVNPVYMTFRNCSRLRVNNLSMQWTNRTTANNFTYGLAAEYCHDIEFNNVRGMGDGWGMTGFNENRRCTFQNCKINRVDTHQPFIEWLRSYDCDLGQWGYHLNALGDVSIRGGSITLSNDSVYTDKVGFILLRDECGGILDGRLTVDDVTLKNYTSTSTQRLVLHRGGPTEVPPVGSPVTYQCASSMVFSNIRSDDRIVELAPQINTSTNIKYPANILVQNCADGIFSFNGDISACTPSTSITPPIANSIDSISNLKVQIESTNIRGNVTLLDTSIPQRFQVDMVLSRLFGNSAFSPSVQVKFGGTLSCSDTVWEGFDFFSGTAIDRYLKVNVSGGGIRHSERFRGVPLNGVNSLVSMSIQGVALQSTTLPKLRSFMLAHCTGCVWSVAGSAPTSTLQVTPDGSASFDTTVVGINAKNLMMLTASVSGTMRRVPFFLPPSGGSTYVQLDSGVFANVTYSGSTIGITTTAGLGGITLAG